MAYRVKRQFSDSTGRSWKPGDHFDAEPEEIERQEQAGNIEEEKPPRGEGGQSGAPA